MIRLLLIVALSFSFLNASSLLQKIIDEADENSIIELPKGIYKGNIVISKPISIIGIEDDVIIEGDLNSSVIIVNSSYVTLKNLTIRGSGERYDNLDAGIVLNNGKQNEVSNCNIYDTLFGIDLRNIDNSLIQNNKITSKDLFLGLRGDGIRLWGSNHNIVRSNSLIKTRDMVVWYSHSNLIEKNYGKDSRYSLHFMYAGKNIIRDNYYENNSVGIFFMYSKDSLAEGNIIKSSQGATGMGIGLKECSSFTLKNNTILYNARGIYIDRSPMELNTINTLDDNKILFNSEGMHFHSISEDNIIKYNTFVGNIENVVNDSRGAKTYKNTWSGNFWDDYEGFDKDSDGIGDTPYTYKHYADKLWLYNPGVKFFYGSPVIGLLNFLAKLAPFSEPLHLLTDKEPKIYKATND